MISIDRLINEILEFTRYRSSISALQDALEKKGIDVDRDQLDKYAPGWNAVDRRQIIRDLILRGMRFAIDEEGFDIINLTGKRLNIFSLDQVTRNGDYYMSTVDAVYVIEPSTREHIRISVEQAFDYSPLDCFPTIRELLTVDVQAVDDVYPTDLIVTQQDAFRLLQASQRIIRKESRDVHLQSEIGWPRIYTAGPEVLSGYPVARDPADLQVGNLGLIRIV